MGNTTMRTILAAALTATLCGQASAMAMTSLLGEPEPNGTPVDKVLRIDAGTHWLNATGNDRVRFLVGDKGFTWHFSDNRHAVNLRDIAPSGFIDRDLLVYLQPDPTYASGD